MVMQAMILLAEVLRRPSRHYCRLQRFNWNHFDCRRNVGWQQQNVLNRQRT